MQSTLYTVLVIAALVGHSIALPQQKPEEIVEVTKSPEQDVEQTIKQTNPFPFAEVITGFFNNITGQNQAANAVDSGAPAPTNNVWDSIVNVFNPQQALSNANGTSANPISDFGNYVSTSFSNTVNSINSALGLQPPTSQKEAEIPVEVIPATEVAPADEKP